MSATNGQQPAWHPDRVRNGYLPTRNDPIRHLVSVKQHADRLIKNLEQAVEDEEWSYVNEAIGSLRVLASQVGCVVEHAIEARDRQATPHEPVAVESMSLWTADDTAPAPIGSVAGV